MISFALVERQSQLCLFEFLYRTYSQGMFQIAYGILHDVQHAEDMVAETYIRVAKNINRIAEIPADKHRSYLKMIIRNICIDYYRSIQPIPSMKYHWIYQIIHLDPKISSSTGLPLKQLCKLSASYRISIEMS